MGKTVVRLAITIESGEYIDPIDGTGEVHTGVHISEVEVLWDFRTPTDREASAETTADREELEEIKKLAGMGNLCDPQFLIQSAIRDAVEACTIPADRIPD